MQDRQEASLSPAALPGLRWAAVMLFLQVAEVIVLVEVIFFDRPRRGIHPQFGAIEIFFAIALASVIIQATGMLLVRRGLYRAGGALQIASSTVHLFKIEGLIGMIGGFRAWNHGRDTVASPSTAAGGPAVVDLDAAPGR